jgi:hypothetical protein
MSQCQKKAELITVLIMPTLSPLASYCQLRASPDYDDIVSEVITDRRVLVN